MPPERYLFEDELHQLTFTQNQQDYDKKQCCRYFLLLYLFSFIFYHQDVKYVQIVYITIIIIMNVRTYVWMCVCTYVSIYMDIYPYWSVSRSHYLTVIIMTIQKNRVQRFPKCVQGSMTESNAHLEVSRKKMKKNQTCDQDEFLDSHSWDIVIQKLIYRSCTMGTQSILPQTLYKFERL